MQEEITYGKFLVKGSVWLWIFSILTPIVGWLYAEFEEALFWTTLVVFINIVNIIGKYFSHRKSFPKQYGNR